MKAVLERFGRVALPAFAVLVVSGLANALIQLGDPSELWQSAYGRVLSVKIGLVGAIALASYLHAVRLRPMLLAANPHPPAVEERRHWRLFATEPALAGAVVIAAAVLVAFPLPPRQLEQAVEARPISLCRECPLPSPRANELSVVERAGSRIAAFWLRRDGERLQGTVRLLNWNERPVETEIKLLGGELEPCGAGCRRFDVARAGSAVTLLAREKGRTYRATVPARWRKSQNRRARMLLRRAERQMRRLRTLREDEHLTSGPGTFVRTRYRFRAPDRFAYVTSSGNRSVVIGKREWVRVGKQPWRAQPFGGVSAARTRDFFRWTPYARAARLLGVRSDQGRRVAQIAIADTVTPVWFRLKIDLGTDRVLADRMITGAHFMSRNYGGFNEPVRIEPPRRSAPRVGVR